MSEVHSPLGRRVLICRAEVGEWKNLHLQGEETETQRHPPTECLRSHQSQDPRKQEAGRVPVRWRQQERNYVVARRVPVASKDRKMAGNSRNERARSGVYKEITASRSVSSQDEKNKNNATYKPETEC